MNNYKRKILNFHWFSSDGKMAVIFRKIIFYLLWNCKNINGKSNKIDIRGLFLKSKIKVRGNNNTVTVHSGGVSKGISIEIYGDNNVIEIGAETHFTSTNISCWDNGNVISIGKNGNIGKSNISCMEGTSIKIGDRCLISYNVEIRTSDSHGIYDFNNKRLNVAKNIVIDNNVWIAQRCLIFKGTYIPVNCVIGANSLVNKSLEFKNSVYVGVPVRCIKREIIWSMERNNENTIMCTRCDD